MGKGLLRALFGRLFLETQMALGFDVENTSDLTDKLRGKRGSKQQTQHIELG